ncbi:MAG: cysteine--tRNA ligase [Bacteroidales bacterium]|nr:cysteine--tRNA ligase [Bacteroidales bacterium]
MNKDLYIFNTLSRKKEKFEAINPPFAGMYVCGPTVYGDAHLGHARPGITFDLIYRYLLHLGYKVRYVRNITDVGHLENDADEGEDKIAKKARLEQLEPMEIAQYFINRYHLNMMQLNTLSPSIEPQASGHIPEQIELIRKIINAGFAYIVNGSVYFDISKYSKTNNYGILSGRVIDELLSNTRELEGQEEKRHPADFALWKKAQPEHIMRWQSEWSEGFPGWHLECSAMGAKYLGESFDIHGGGMDLLFPHHESEIAQSVAANGKAPVRYWIHNNMITINGQKMSKSLNNFITLNDLFTGKHPSLDKAYSPMTIRFFILQAQYRSTLDFSNEALLAAEKGFKRMMQAYVTLMQLQASAKSSTNIQVLINNCYEAMNDDFNSPIVIANVFEAVKLINLAKDKKENLTEEDIKLLKKLYEVFIFEILGMRNEASADNNELTGELMNIILSLRKELKNKKDYQSADKIRTDLEKINITIKDTKEGTEWSF